MNETFTAQTSNRQPHTAQDTVLAIAPAEWLLFAESWLSACRTKTEFSQPLATMKAALDAQTVTVFHVPAMRAPAALVASSRQTGTVPEALGISRTDIARLSRDTDVHLLPQLSGGQAHRPRAKQKAKQQVHIAVIVLGRGAAGYDIMEVTFGGQPAEGTTENLAAMAAFLIRTWTPTKATTPVQDGAAQAGGDHQPHGVLGEMNPYKLSRSEMRVCKMIGQGMSPADIAASLGLSVETIRTHLKGVFAKTNTSSQRELMLMIFKQTPLRAAS